MKPENPLDVLIEQAANLSAEQLQELYAAIKSLIEARTGETIDTTTSQAQPSGRTLGSIEWKIIPDTKRGKVYGPYPYLRYWQAGHLKSKYLKGYQVEPPPEALQRLEQAKAALLQKEQQASQEGD